RTFALARLALQAQVHRIVQSGIGQSFELELAREGEAESVCPAARAVLLLPGRLVGRTHGPAALLAALADAGTQFRRADHPAVGAEVEAGWHLRGNIAGAETQVRCQRRGTDDLAGIEDIVGIKCPLQLAECLVEYRAEHLLLKRTANQPIAMFSGKS